MKKNGGQILRRLLQLYKAKMRIQITEFFLKSRHLEPRKFWVECEKCKDKIDVLFVITVYSGSNCQSLLNSKCRRVPMRNFRLILICY
jgi:hypothetical protein